MRTNKHMRPSGHHHRSFTRALITRPTCVPCAVARTLTRGSGALEVAATVTGSAPEVFPELRLHVRCEHRAGERCFAFGGTLRRFELCSTDADWQPQYQRAAARQPWLHKALALEGASLFAVFDGHGEGGGPCAAALRFLERLLQAAVDLLD